MDNYAVALRQAQGAPAQAWQQVALPTRRTRETLPLRREVLGLVDQPGWEGLELPLSVCVVRDTSAEKVEYWVLVCTQPTRSAKAIDALFRQRWGIEECSMALARDHGMNDLYPCRPGLALAQIHFTLLAHTLRYLCLAQAARQVWPRTKYLVVHWAGCYALLHASEAFVHFELWQDRQEEILAALRSCEGG